jgi:hypothetical protein
MKAKRSEVKSEMHEQTVEQSSNSAHDGQFGRQIKFTVVCKSNKSVARQPNRVPPVCSIFPFDSHRTPF